MRFFAAFVIEQMAFKTNYVWPFLRYRLTGAMTEAFVPGAAEKFKSTA